MRRFVLAVLAAVAMMLAADAARADRSAVIDRDRMEAQLASALEELARLQGRIDVAGERCGRRAMVGSLQRVQVQLRLLQDDLRAARELAVALVPPPPQVSYTMDDRTFEQLLVDLGAQSFTDGRLRVLREALGSEWLTTGQVVAVLKHFEFSGDRLMALRLMAPWLADRASTSGIEAAFTFDADRKKAGRILSKVRRGR